MSLNREQLEERKNFIGASEAAAICGLSRWSSPLEIWALKTGQIQPAEENLAMWMGNELEEAVAKRFTIETGKKVHRINDTVYHKKYSFIACHLDRKVEGEDAILECKTTSAWKYKEWSDEVPPEYLLQVYHQLACTGYKKGYLACFIGNQEFVIKEVQRDEKIIADLIKKEVDFWQSYVIPKVMPATIKAQDDDVLLSLYPQAIETEPVPLPDEASAICENLDSLSADKKVLEREIEEQRNELKAMLGENEVGETALYKISWKNQVTKKLDTRHLKETEPEIYMKYSKEIKNRVLRIKKIEEEENDQ